MLLLPHLFFSVWQPLQSIMPLWEPDGQQLLSDSLESSLLALKGFINAILLASTMLPRPIRIDVLCALH